MIRLEEKLRTFQRVYFTDTELDMLLGGTLNSRYSKVKRLIKQGKFLHVRRGLYCLADNIGYAAKPHPFELAQFIYGPSYISFESALSFHQLIPEAVFTITSAAGKRSNQFETPLGIYSYLQLPLENLYTGVELIQANNHRFLMAKPWKAICDYIYCYKKNWRSLQPLLESLRIDRENLPMLRAEEIQQLDEYYRQARISRFLKNIQSELAYEY